MSDVCELCEEQAATIRCAICSATGIGDKFCQGCSASLHTTAKGKLHVLTDLEGKPLVVAAPPQPAEAAKPPTGPAAGAAGSASAAAASFPVASIPVCNLCEDSPSVTQCKNCDAAYCQPCCTDFHKPAKQQGHTLLKIVLNGSDGPPAQSVATASTPTSPSAQPSAAAAAFAHQRAASSAIGGLTTIPSANPLSPGAHQRSMSTITPSNNLLLRSPLLSATSQPSTPGGGRNLLTAAAGGNKLAAPRMSLAMFPRSGGPAGATSTTTSPASGSTFAVGALNRPSLLAIKMPASPGGARNLLSPIPPTSSITLPPPVIAPSATKGAESAGGGGGGDKKLCGICELEVATQHCDECRDDYCDECDIDVHTTASKRLHVRTKIMPPAPTSAPASASPPTNPLLSPPKTNRLLATSPSAPVIPAAKAPEPEKPSVQPEPEKPAVVSTPVSAMPADLASASFAVSEPGSAVSAVSPATSASSSRRSSLVRAKRPPTIETNRPAEPEGEGILDIESAPAIQDTPSALRPAASEKKAETAVTPTPALSSTPAESAKPSPAVAPKPADSVPISEPIKAETAKVVPPVATAPTTEPAKPTTAAPASAATTTAAIPHAATAGAQPSAVAAVTATPPPAAASPMEIVPEAEGGDLCGMCEDEKAEVYCAECKMGLCVAGGCDRDLHRPAKMAGHRRTPITKSATPTAAAVVPPPAASSPTPTAAPAAVVVEAPKVTPISPAVTAAAPSQVAAAPAKPDSAPMLPVSAASTVHPAPSSASAAGELGASVAPRHSISGGVSFTSTLPVVLESSPTSSPPLGVSPARGISPQPSPKGTDAAKVSAPPAASSCAEKLPTTPTAARHTKTPILNAAEDAELELSVGDLDEFSIDSSDLAYPLADRMHGASRRGSRMPISREQQQQLLSAINGTLGQKGSVAGAPTDAADTKTKVMFAQGGSLLVDNLKNPPHHVTRPRSRSRSPSRTRSPPRSRSRTPPPHVQHLRARSRSRSRSISPPAVSPAPRTLNGHLRSPSRSRSTSPLARHHRHSRDHSRDRAGVSQMHSPQGLQVQFSPHRGDFKQHPTAVHLARNGYSDAGVRSRSLSPRSRTRSPSPAEHSRSHRSRSRSASRYRHDSRSSSRAPSQQSFRGKDPPFTSGYGDSSESSSSARGQGPLPHASTSHSSSASNGNGRPVSASSMRSSDGPDVRSSEVTEPREAAERRRRREQRDRAREHHRHRTPSRGRDAQHASDLHSTVSALVRDNSQAATLMAQLLSTLHADNRGESHSSRATALLQIAQLATSAAMDHHSPRPPSNPDHVRERNGIVSPRQSHYKGHEDGNLTPEHPASRRLDDRDRWTAEAAAEIDDGWVARKLHERERASRPSSASASRGKHNRGRSHRRAHGQPRSPLLDAPHHGHHASAPPAVALYAMMAPNRPNQTPPLSPQPPSYPMNGAPYQRVGGSPGYGGHAAFSPSPAWASQNGHADTGLYGAVSPNHPHAHALAPPPRLQSPMLTPSPPSPGLAISPVFAVPPSSPLAAGGIALPVQPPPGVSPQTHAMALAVAAAAYHHTGRQIHAAHAAISFSYTPAAAASAAALHPYAVYATQLNANPLHAAMTSPVRNPTIPPRL